MLEQLPQRKQDEDGHRVGSLDAFIEGKAKSRRKSRTTKGPTSIEDPTFGTGDSEYDVAIAAGQIPNTPLAREVFDNWKRFPDCVLLTRVGKFYESYFAPAVQLSSLLSLKLAYKRYSNGDFPFSGFPVHQLDKYLKILVQDLGHTVVLVEEYDEEGRKEGLDPIRKISTSNGELKDRRIGRVVTPGTLVEESWISGDESRYLLAIAVGRVNGGRQRTSNKSERSSADHQIPLDEVRISLAYTDPATGEFFTKETTMEYIEDEIARIAPREVVLDSSMRNAWTDTESAADTSSSPTTALLDLLRVFGIYVSFASSTAPEPDKSVANTASLETQAITLLRHHLEFALRDSMPALTLPNRQKPSQTMLNDAATLSALEIRHAIRPGGVTGPDDSTPSGRSNPLSTRGTLLSTISQTMTPSGHRHLIRSLTSPSTVIRDINNRLDLVQAFAEREELRTDVRDMMRTLGDVMRIMQRFKGRRGDGRDAWEMVRWVRSIERISSRLQRDLPGQSSSRSTDVGLKRLRDFVADLKSLSDLADLIEGAVDEGVIMSAGTGDEDGIGSILETDQIVGQSVTPADEVDRSVVMRTRRADDTEVIRNPWWIKANFTPELQSMHQELDNLRKQHAKMEKDLRKNLGIEKLTLTRNRSAYVMTIGSRLEFAKVDKLRRFAGIYEGRNQKSYAYNAWSVLGANTDKHIEDMLFAQRRAWDQLRDIIVARADDVQHNSELVDELDVAMSFAQTAVDSNYVRPILDDSTDLSIVNGRHPTVESSLLNSSRAFTPNSTDMTSDNFLHIITGPNQGGKSTLLRQTAVIAILAQAGSYVPADQARIGIVDRVFSRIGARDDLFRDRSTFMLEMVETAAILRHATPKSLVIMDEIGRGTTLHSGLSIAYATLDHILSHIKCRTLFATHYHEIADLLRAEGEARGGVDFWCTDVDETEGAFSYHYKLRHGINHHSHAIKAARLAGMPSSFLQVAQTTLDALDRRRSPPLEGQA